MTDAEARPIVTVDAALFTLLDDHLAVALQRREREPFKGAPALIGGYVRPDEDADGAGAMARILAEKVWSCSRKTSCRPAFSARMRAIAPAPSASSSGRT